MRPLILLLFLAACSESVPAEFVLSDDGAFHVAGPDIEKPRLRYLDGQISLNDSCAIRLPNKLNPSIPPMYVNGAPIGFC